MSETDPLFGQRVLLVDDQRMFVDALTRIVEDAGMVVQGVAHSLADLERAPAAPAPDFVLLDYRLPDGDALKVLPTLAGQWPATVVILITGYMSSYTVNGALAAGAAAVVSKTRAAGDILDTMREQLSSGVRSTEPSDGERPSVITPRELEVLGLIAEGMSLHEIAARLSIAPSTTRNHIRNILRKLDATSQLDAVLKAVKLGLVNITGSS